VSTDVEYVRRVRCHGVTWHSVYYGESRRCVPWVSYLLVDMTVCSETSRKRRPPVSHGPRADAAAKRARGSSIPGRSPPANEAAIASIASAIRHVVRGYKVITDGMVPNIEGVAGSFNPSSLAKVLHALGVKKGTTLLDLGCSDFRFGACALETGANVYGCELPANKDTCEDIREKVAHRLPPNAVRGRAEVSYSDILELQTLPGNPDIVFSFSAGIPGPEQRHFIELIAASETVHTVGLTRSVEFNTPAELLAALNSGGRTYAMMAAIKVYMAKWSTMFWVFSRGDDASGARAAGDDDGLDLGLNHTSTATARAERGTSPPSRSSGGARAVSWAVLLAASRRVRGECAGECRRVRPPGEDDG